jgi:hypothetical protein
MPEAAKNQPPQPSKTSDTVRLTDTTLVHLETLMTTAVQKGINDAINEELAERFWSAGLKVLQRQATDHAGRFVLGGLWSMLQRLSMFVVLGGVMYAVGGWTALAGLFKTIFSTGSAP